MKGKCSGRNYTFERASADMSLLVDNARTFNGESSVTNAARQLFKFFHDKMKSSWSEGENGSAAHVVLTLSDPAVTRGAVLSVIRAVQSATRAGRSVITDPDATAALLVLAIGDMAHDMSQLCAPRTDAGVRPSRFQVSGSALQELLADRASPPPALLAACRVMQNLLLEAALGVGRVGFDDAPTDTSAGRSAIDGLRALAKLPAHAHSRSVGLLLAVFAASYSSGPGATTSGGFAESMRERGFFELARAALQVPPNGSVPMAPPHAATFVTIIAIVGRRISRIPPPQPSTADDHPTEAISAEPLLRDLLSRVVLPVLRALSASAPWLTSLAHYEVALLLLRSAERRALSADAVLSVLGEALACIAGPPRIASASPDSRITAAASGGGVSDAALLWQRPEFAAPRALYARLATMSVDGQPRFDYRQAAMRAFSAAGLAPNSALLAPVQFVTNVLPGWWGSTSANASASGTLAAAGLPSPLSSVGFAATGGSGPTPGTPWGYGLTPVGIGTPPAN